MTSPLTLYGIRNCDTVKKARAWLDAAKRPHQFHDYKTAGVDADRLRGWVAELGWERVINRAGTTFRGLADADKADLDAEKAIALMMARPSLIKRPMLVGERLLIAGFKPETYAAALG